jgi:acyl-CoA thioesterase
MSPDKPSPLTPAQITAGMMGKDNFSRWLGLHIDETGPGYCRLHYRITEEMLNGFGIVHGGVLFSAADSAFAFACNSHGTVTLALDASISFARPARSGDLIFVDAREVHLGNKTGIYEVRTTNEAGQLVALFKGTAYRTSQRV